MGFTMDESMVKVEFFDVKGEMHFKWYTTEAVEWLFYETNVSANSLKGYCTPEEFAKFTFNKEGKTFLSLQDALRLSLRECFKDRLNAYNGMIAVCDEPYHEHLHPIMIEWKGEDMKLNSNRRLKPCERCGKLVDLDNSEYGELQNKFLCKTCFDVVNEMGGVD